MVIPPNMVELETIDFARKLNSPPQRHILYPVLYNTDPFQYISYSFSMQHSSFIEHKAFTQTILLVHVCLSGRPLLEIQCAFDPFVNTELPVVFLFHLSLCFYQLQWDPCMFFTQVIYLCHPFNKLYSEIL